MKKFIPLLFTLSLLVGISNASAQNCDFDPSWLVSNSQNLPSDVPNNPTDCDFHQFIMQYFASETYGPSPEFLTWMPVQGVFDANSNVLPNPVPWGDTTKAFQKLYIGVQGNEIASNLTLQAGSGEPLMAQNFTYTFYDVRMNKTMYDFITSTCDLHYDSSNNNNVCKNDPSIDRFPAGAIELKVAWKIIDPNVVNKDLFINTKGWVSTTGNSYQEVTLIMVGYHLVIATPKHPEFIWGTFENRTNSPDCPGSFGVWSYNDPLCSGCKTNEYIPHLPTQVCLVNPQGGGTKNNVDAVQQIDTSFAIQAGIKASRLALYKFDGSLWTKGGVAPYISSKVPNTAAQKGSTKLANSVAETYKQADNCFSCHNYTGPSKTGNGDKPLDVTHINFVVTNKSSASKKMKK